MAINVKLQYKIVFIIGIFLFSGCDHSPTSLNKYQLTTEKKNNLKINNSLKNTVNIQKTTISIPKNLSKLTGTLANTNIIGTPDYPTINGGIINSTDILFVDYTAENKKTLSQDKIVTTVLVNTKKYNKSFLDDGWVTSGKVKKLLITASQQGKLSYVLKKSDQMGLPASIAVIPMIESNYDTNAISSKGAAGVWQLMPSIAKDYGIENQDRFKFTTSTTVALQLLIDLYNRYGNWELTFAAYNAGSKRVSDAIRKNPQAKVIDDLDLPTETKNYVKRIMRISKMMTELSIDD